MRILAVFLLVFVGGGRVARAEESAPPEFYFDVKAGSFASELPVGKPFKIKIRASVGVDAELAYLKQPKGKCPKAKEIFEKKDQGRVFAMMPEGPVEGGQRAYVSSISRLYGGNHYCFAVRLGSFFSRAEKDDVEHAMDVAVKKTVAAAYEAYSRGRKLKAREMLLATFVEELKRRNETMAGANYIYKSRGRPRSIGEVINEALDDNAGALLALTQLAAQFSKLQNPGSLGNPSRDSMMSDAVDELKKDGAWQALLNDFSNMIEIYTERAHTPFASATEARPFYVSLDVGVGAGLFPGHGSVLQKSDVFQYVGVNFYPSAVDKEEPLEGLTSDFKKRFSLTAGFTTSLGLKSAEDEGVKGLLGGARLLFGAGYRLTSYVRLSGGAVVYRYENPHPLSNQKGLGASPYLSLSLDFDTFSWLREQASKI